MISHLIDQLVGVLGVIGIFAGMLAESACIPLPSEVIMPLGGYFAGTGRMVFWQVVAAGVLGNAAGSVLAYWVGRVGGRPLIRKFGRWVRISENHLSMAERWFAKHGEWTVLIGRWLPVVRTFISLPAGISRMSFPRFFVYTVAGCIPWVWLFAWLGLYLGQDLGVVKSWLDHLNIVIAVVVIAIILLIWRKGIKPEKKESQSK